MKHFLACLSIVVAMGCIENKAQRDPDRRSSTVDAPGPPASTDSTAGDDAMERVEGLVAGHSSTASDAMNSAGNASTGGTPSAGFMLPGDIQGGADTGRTDGARSDSESEPSPTPPRQISVENRCDGLDDDTDGFVDEGVSNICGGCGGIPPTGCRLWGVELTHLFPGELQPGIIASPILASLGQSRFEVPNGQCQLQRIVLSVDENEHLGDLTIQSGATSFTVSPEYDTRMQRPVYRTPEDWVSEPLFEPGATVEVSTSGQPPFEAFEQTLIAPANLDEVTEADLRTFAEQTQTFEPGQSARLTWASAGSDGRPLSLFYGGSRLVFRQTVSYQAIEFFTLSLSLVDDGELSVPYALFGQRAPSTAYRIFLRRDRGTARLFGPHRVALSLGEVLTVRETASETPPLAQTPPFSIISPSPNRPTVSPGEVMRVEWTDMPRGTGPLEVRLNVRDPVSNQQHLLVCSVTDHALGFLEIPAERTAVLSDRSGSTNKLSLYWRIMAQGAAEPDVGEYTHSMSVLLDLDVQSSIPE